jgi:glycine cleavage system H lipoate-binding protein
MPEMNGIQLLEHMKEQDLSAPVLMITGYPSIRTALQALRLGAVDYLAKPFTRQELLGPVNRTLRGAPDLTVAEPAVRETPGDADGFAEPELKLVPGDRYYLRQHSWADFQQDGTMLVGIEASFLRSIGVIASVELPEEAELVEQGLTGCRVRTTDDEQHGVFMPLSGQVMALNQAAAGDPSSIGPQTWLLRIMPVNLDTELPLLLKG